MSEHIRTVEILNDLGLHLRAAGQVVRVAARFNADITIERGSLKANAKSIMSVLSLAAPKGTKLLVRCAGNDADGALEALCALVARGFEAE